VTSDFDDFRSFCAEYLVQSKDRWAGKPLLLEEFQCELMQEALAYEPDSGRPVWDSVVICMPRKNGKTELLAAYALFRLLTDVGLPEIILAASSDKQAGRLFEAASLYVRQNVALDQLVRVRDHAGELKREDGQGVIYRMSSDPRRLHGYNPTLVVLDELAQWTTPELMRAHGALTSASGARSAPQVFSISTAGEARDREDSILGRVLDSALASDSAEKRPGRVIARLAAARTLVWNFEAPTTDPHDIAAMKLANPASWITEEFLERQAESPELTDAQVLQLHGGVWAAGESTWLPAGVWRECQIDRGAPHDGVEIILGFDGSYKRDSTALVGCTVEERPHLFVVGVWERPEGSKTWKVPREEVKARVDDAMGRWDVLEFVCDPPGWHAEIEEWGEMYADTITLMFETGRVPIMAEACSKFYSAVLEKRLSHDGDKALARHLANATVKITPNGKHITKDAPDSPRKIDLAVAAVIAHARSLDPARRYSGPLFEVLF
jgi:phage terminase large subunit-like protein